MSLDSWFAVLMAVLGGAIRVGTPFIFVSLGECLTEKAGRINLGLEGVLVLSAMAAFGVAYLTGSAWLGVLAAALALIQPQAPTLPVISLGSWSDHPQVRSALDINVLFPLGVVLALILRWALANTRWGLTVRMVGDSSDAARALGTSVSGVRAWSTAIGGAIAGLGGASLSLYYPGSWNEGLSSGQGLIAVALVIFARWKPIACLGAALLFGGAGALGPALQSVGVTGYYYLVNAVPYVLTLLILILTCAPRRSLRGAPGELGVQRLG